VSGSEGGGGPGCGGDSAATDSDDESSSDDPDARGGRRSAAAAGGDGLGSGGGGEGAAGIAAVVQALLVAGPARPEVAADIAKTAAAMVAGLLGGSAALAAPALGPRQQTAEGTEVAPTGAGSRDVGNGGACGGGGAERAVTRDTVEEAAAQLASAYAKYVWAKSRAPADAPNATAAAFLPAEVATARQGGLSFAAEALGCGGFRTPAGAAAATACVHAAPHLPVTTTSGLTATTEGATKEDAFCSSTSSGSSPAACGLEGEANDGNSLLGPSDSAATCSSGARSSGPDGASHGGKLPTSRVPLHGPAAISTAGLQQGSSVPAVAAAVGEGLPALQAAASNRSLGRAAGRLAPACAAMAAATPAADLQALLLQLVNQAARWVGYWGL
jgi:hypothetical protein